MFEALLKVRDRRIRAEELTALLSRPRDQVLHVLSYMTSLGLLDARRDDGVWSYALADLSGAC